MGWLYSQLFVTPPYPRTPFTGQTVIVTGANVGLGKEAARHIVRLNAAKVILAVRNIEAGEEARREIAAETGRNADIIHVWTLDLSSSESVKAFAQRACSLDRLDAVIENAGIATGTFELVEGFERTIKVKVISTFQLALLLYPKLRSTAREFKVHTRISIVSSEMHGWTEFKERDQPRIFDTLNDMTFRKADRYCVSKLLQILVVRQLARSFESVSINTLNPGLCESQLTREFDKGLVDRISFFLLARSAEVGSRNLVAAASFGPEANGAYINDGRIANEDLYKFVRSNEGEKVAEKVLEELRTITNGDKI